MTFSNATRILQSLWALQHHCGATVSLRHWIRTSGFGLAAAFQHETDVVCAQDLPLEVAHEFSQAGEAAVRAVQAVATFLHLDLKVLELPLATCQLPFRKESDQT